MNPSAPVPTVWTVLTVLLPTVLTVLLPSASPAQVGHAPESSPYRDIRYSSFLALSGGRVFGSGGEAGVAPHDGVTGGLRFVFLANRPVQIGLGAFYGDLERVVQDPTEPPDSRTSGPISQRVIWADATLTLNLTGRKSWRGLAPFVGAAGGLAFTESTPQDSSGFRMGTKFYLAPFAGTRLFLGQRLYLNLEARALFWQPRYPATFLNPPTTTGDPVPLVSTGKEWLLTPWLQAGIGWAVSWPF